MLESLRPSAFTHSTRRMLLHILLVASIALVLRPDGVGSSEDVPLATQGQFAVKLVEKLGLGRNVDADKAVSILSALSIVPGVGPGARWEKDSPASSMFVAQIQASIQVLLKNLSTELGISPPPTLDLHIFEVPPAPQRVFFPQSLSSKTPPPRGASGPMPPPPTAPPLEETPAKDPPTAGKGSGKEHIGRSVPDTPGAQVDRAILSVLSEKREAPVIVTVRQGQDAGPADQGNPKAFFERCQDLVLKNLSQEEFRLKHRFETSCSFAGWVSKEGLHKLQNSVNVESVSLDSLASPQ